MGGTCLHQGCIPAKELLQTAEVLRTVPGAKEFGVDVGQPTLDLAVSQTRKQQVIDKLTKGLEATAQGPQGDGRQRHRDAGRRRGAPRPGLRRLGARRATR